MLKPEELMEFESHFEKIHTESFSWNLWGAAYLMNGGCSDDGFDYFRAWLMAQGQQTFDKVVKDPDTLATLADPASLMTWAHFVVSACMNAVSPS